MGVPDRAAWYLIVPFWLLTSGGLCREMPPNAVWCRSSRARLGRGLVSTFGLLGVEVLDRRSYASAWFPALISDRSLITHGPITARSPAVRCERRECELGGHSCRGSAWRFVLEMDLNNHTPAARCMIADARPPSRIRELAMVSIGPPASRSEGGITGARERAVSWSLGSPTI
jgi:hypothetical protein